MKEESYTTNKEIFIDIGEQSLRPKSLGEFVGQKQNKENLEVYIKAAKIRKQPLDHVLLFGPPGLGKTTLSNIIALELGVGFRATSGPAIERAADLVAILTSLEEGEVLFIDEIHRLSRPVEEILYPALEDGFVDIILGKGPSARTMNIPLKPFSLIGATTRQGQLSGPLRDRFGITIRLEMYSGEELSEIVSRSASILGIKIEKDASLEIAKRSRGTPRIANRILRRVSDYALVDGLAIIKKEVVCNALGLMQIDNMGLDTVDRKILLAIIEKYNGGPVGLETIAATIFEEGVTIEDAVEPFLLQLGFLQRTAKGRMATLLAYKHLNKKPPKGLEQISMLNDT